MNRGSPVVEPKVMVDVESLVVELRVIFRVSTTSGPPMIIFQFHVLPKPEPRDHGPLTPAVFSRSEAPDGTNEGKGLQLCADVTCREYKCTYQTSSTRYLLRVVTVVVRTVTSFTIVPNSSLSVSVCRSRVEDCPVVSPSYGGREPEPGVSDDDLEGAKAPSIFWGINFQILQAPFPCPSS